LASCWLSFCSGMGMMSNHTPGPWTVIEKIRPLNGEKYYCVVSDSGLVLDNISAEANAHLIAAAPEMLEALKSISNTTYYDEYGVCVSTMDIPKLVEALITKAEGIN